MSLEFNAGKLIERKEVVEEFDMDTLIRQRELLIVSIAAEQERLNAVNMKLNGAKAFGWIEPPPNGVSNGAGPGGDSGSGGGAGGGPTPPPTPPPPPDPGAGAGGGG